MCTAIHTTRVTLYRKLTALTGKNIEDYLRAFRLNKAHEMLRTTGLSVQDVAWACGFREPATFTRAFQKAFGVLPSQVRS